MKTRANQRRGFFAVAVIVVLIVLATLLMAFTRSIVSQSRQSRDRQYHRQAIWLAESGMELGRAKLRANSDYKGETWTLPPASIAGGAHVVITVRETPDSDADASESKTIEVIAKFPLDVYSPASAELKLNTTESSTGDGA
jgi:Tfp pilus assembly protein PilX